VERRGGSEVAIRHRNASGVLAGLGATIGRKRGVGRRLPVFRDVAIGSLLDPFRAKEPGPPPPLTGGGGPVPRLAFSFKAAADPDLEPAARFGLKLLVYP